MPRPKFLALKRATVAWRRQIVMQLYLTNMHTIDTIVEELQERYDCKATREVVWNDIDTMTKMSVQRALDTTDQLREKELQKLDALESMVMANAAPEIIIRDEDDVVSLLEADQELRERREKTAEVLLKIAQRRAALKGLDSPTKQEHSGPDGGPIQVEDVRAKLLGKLGE